MANQAIALQARAPQTNFMGAAIQRNAQMINQMTQQRAAERQSAVAQQQMELARAKEARDVTAAQVELAKNVAANFRDQLNMLPPNDVAGAQALRQQVVETIPGWDKILPSAEQIAMDPQTRQRLLMKADEIVKYSYATPVASTTMDEAGNAFSTVAGGLPGVAGAFPMQQYALDPNATVAPPPSPTAAPTPPRLSQPAPVAPEALDAAAQAIAGGKGVNDPALRNLPPAAFDEAQKRAMRLRLDTMPPVEGAMQPMSAQQGQPDLAQVVNDMMATGFVTQSNLEAMRQVAGPDKDAQLAEILRSNNIQILPDEGAEQFRSAVYRPEEGAATLQRGAPDATLEEAQYVPTGRQFKGKSPMQSPVPGSSQVPLPRVAAEARAQRETPGEVYQKELARRRAERDAAIQGGPKPLTPVQEAKLRDNIAKDYKSAQSTIDMMLNPVSGVVAAVQSVRNLTPAQKEAITGLSGYFYSVTPSSRQADTKIKNLKGKVTEMGKAAASLTGAIGQMAVQEWRIVSDMIASLDLEGMEPSDLDDQLSIIEAQARRAAAITQDAYENQYVEEFARYPNRFQLKTPAAAAAAKGGGKSSGWGKARVVGD